MSRIEFENLAFEEDHDDEIEVEITEVPNDEYVYHTYLNHLEETNLRDWLNERHRRRTCCCKCRCHEEDD